MIQQVKQFPIGEKQKQAIMIQHNIEVQNIIYSVSVTTCMSVKS